MKKKQDTQYLQGIADMIQGVESSPFDPVTTFSTEKIKGASPWLHMELILYNSTQPVNGFPHIRSACYDIDFIGGCDIP